jgi:adenosylcobinamide amidohydrolase
VSAALQPAPELERVGPWLIVRLGAVHRVASWAIHGGGVGRASTVAWLRVADGELRPPVEPRAFLCDRLAAARLDDAVGLLTSADLDRYAEHRASWRDCSARAVVTAGLGNALRVGDPPGPAGRIGTINVLCQLDTPLTDEGLLEAMSIAVEARTAAVLAANLPSRRSGQPSTGTGTDCVVIAAPDRNTSPGTKDLGMGTRDMYPSPGPSSPATYAGKHTALGHVVGAAVEAATAEAVARWQEARR